MSGASSVRRVRSPKANDFVRFTQDIQAAVAILEFVSCYENDVAKLCLWDRLLRWQPRPPLDDSENHKWFSAGYMHTTRFAHDPDVDVAQRYAQACAKYDAIRTHGGPRLQRLRRLAFGDVETPVVVAVQVHTDAPTLHLSAPTLGSAPPWSDCGAGPSQ